MKLSSEQQRIAGGDISRLLIDGVPGAGKSQLLVELTKRILADTDKLFIGGFGRKDTEKLSQRLENAGLHDVKAQTIHSLAYNIVWDDVKLKVSDKQEQAKRFLSEIGTLKLVHGRQRSEIVEKAETAVRMEANSPPLSDEIDYLHEIDMMKSAGKRVGINDAKYDDRLAVYYHYNRLLQSDGLVDFGELLLKAEDCLRTENKLRQRYSFDAIVIDELQDFSLQQLRLLAPLMQNAKVVICSADVKQAIYGFRQALGAGIEGKLREVLPDIRTEQLVMNHRSAPAIVNYAERVYKRGMTAVKSKLNGSVTVYDKTFATSGRHAEAILRQIQQWRDMGIAFKDMAILCRTRNAMPPIEECLYENKIPVVKGIRPFTDLPEVKDLLAWMQMSDAKLMFKRPGKLHPLWRIYNAPRTFGKTNVWLGKEWEKQAWRVIKETIDPDVYHILKPSHYDAKYAKALRVLQANIESVQFIVKPADIIHYVVNIMEPRYSDYQLRQAPETLGDPLDNIDNMLMLARHYDDVGEFINFLKQIDRILKADAIELTTVHQYKGREAKAVCLVNTIGNYLRYADWREEKNIRYVGITRPSQYLAITTVMV